MARTPGTLSLGSNIEPKMAAPLDGREVVNSKADLLAAASFPYFYEGMTVYVKSEQKSYTLTGNDTTIEANWTEVGSGAGQTIQVDTLPTATSELEGTIYQYVGATTATLTNGYFYKCVESTETVGTYLWTAIPTTDAIPSSKKGVANGVAELDASGKVPSSQLPSYVDDVIEGYYNTTDGKFYEEDTYTTEIPGETGKIYVDLATEKTYRWSGSAFVEISESLALGETSSTAYAGNKGKQNADNITALQTSKQDILQYSTMPTPTSTDAGKIVQFTGTTGTYTNGYFYECVEDSENVGSYIWVAKSVQDSSSSSGSLGTAIISNITVGGITSGTTYNVGTSYDTLWKNLLCPTLYPSFTAPSATISATGSKLLEVGATVSSTITVSFSRGSISPAYGTSGYRSGAATSYALNGGTSQSSNEFTETVTGSNKSFQATVEYAAGEQPKDSNGDNYSSPLAAGSCTSNTVNFEFVNALWSNTSDITAVAKNSLVSKSTKQNVFNFPAATVANPEIFDVPASWTITAVEVLNTLSNQYEDCASTFTITDTTHDDAGGTSTAYKRYTCNLGYNMDSRKIRIKWS